MSVLSSPIKQENVTAEGILYYVSTVKLIKKNIYETMVFYLNDWYPLRVQRYITKEEALVGHNDIVYHLKTYGQKWS